MSTKYILFIFLTLSLFSSCELEDNSIFEEGTNSATAVELLPAAIKQVAFNQTAIGGRSAGALMQYFQEFDSGSLPYRSYTLVPEFTENLWSSGFYAGSLASLIEIEALATEENEEDLMAISLILQANGFGSLTNMYGDIPFSEAVKGASKSKPIYDLQSEVYQGIIGFLDEAIEIIGEKSTNSSIATEDLIFQGNMQSWKKLAYGLKARYLLNQRNRIPNKEQEILNLIENSFQSHAEQAEFTFDTNSNSPQYSYSTTRPSTLYLADFFIDQLLNTNDPRRPKFAMEDFFWEYFIADEFVPKWFEATATTPILSYTELLFMKAELSIYLGEAQTESTSLLEEAISASMEENEVNFSDETLSFIEAESNLVGLSEEEMVEQIMVQAHIAYFGYNYYQTWNNFRRTGYPSLEPTTSLTTPINATGSIPVRFLYPQSELDYNTENVEDAKLRQGGANLDGDMWVFFR